MRPLPTETELLAGYERGYGPYPSSDSDGLSLRQDPRGKVRAIEWLRRYWHILDGNATMDRLDVRGRVLDVGAGHGENVEFLMRRGYQVVGVEPNPLAANSCERRGLNVLCGTVESLDLEPETFDTAILSQVIEHLLNPKGSLEHVAWLLRPGGRVIIFTPNAKGAPARIFGSNWAHWHVPYHVYLYGPAQLKRLLAATGFRVELLGTVSPGYWLNMSFKLWRHDSQRTGWRLPADKWQPSAAVRIAIAPMMRTLDLLTMGDCLVAIGMRI